MHKGPQPTLVRDANKNVVNGLRIQRSKSKTGRQIERYYAVDGDGRRKYFGNSLRKSAQSAAASSQEPAVPYQQYQVLAGHKLSSVDDHYIRRNPRMVELACRAIEDYYFPHGWI